MTEQDALRILNAVPALGAGRIRKLCSFFGSGPQVLTASLDQLAASNLVGPKTAENICHFSKDKFLRDEYNLMRRKHIEVLTRADESFPIREDFDDMPVVLYVKGRKEALNQKAISVVGSRAASFYGCESARCFSRAFAQAGLAVVSGLARGIDTAAHHGCLDAGGRTIAVVGCGFNYIYPQENRALVDTIALDGAVVSEFAFDMPPLKQNFPWRNRIISAFGLATVVVEAGKNSGALITADYALAQNKDVFVLPSNIDSESALGSNRLIQDGARVALNPDDVLSQVLEGPYARPVPNKVPLLLSDEQSRVYPLITTRPVHLDELAQKSGLSIASLLNVALSLELKRTIRQLPGQYYVRIEHD